MLVRMPLVGTGGQGDPLRTIMPTHRVIDVDYVNGRAIVDVPSEDAPDDVDAAGTPRWLLMNGVPVLIGLTPLQRLAWRQKLRQRWAAIGLLPDPAAT